jgi:hypothetical protein
VAGEAGFAIQGGASYGSVVWLSMFADGLLLGSLDFFFRLEPVVKLRAGFIAALDVEFIRSSSDTFFKG